MVKSTMIAAAAVAVVTATPAFAQWGTYRGPGWSGAGPRVYAQYYGPRGWGISQCRRQHSPNPAWDVCDPGAASFKGTPYVGSDPDPRVRQQLQWDPSQGGNR